MQPPQPEPWLRGALPDVPAHLMPIFFSFAQVREDLANYAAPLSPEQIWRPVNGASIGFHLKHMAGSVDRLSTYLLGDQLSETQIANLKVEHEGTEDPSALLRFVDQALYKAEDRLRSVAASTLFDARTVGRKQLPTTVLGLLVHIAEHTQRHLGQVITLCKDVRQAA